MRLEDLTVIGAPVDRCFDLARSVEVHLAGNVHSGEAAVAVPGSGAGVNPGPIPTGLISTGLISTGLISMSQRVTWRAKHFGVWHSLTSEITAMDRPAYFQDTMTQGIFRYMKHDHYFRPLSPDETEMKDVFCFAAPLPVLGRLAEMAFLGRYMHALLRERNAVLKEIAESPEWQRYLPSSL